MSTTLGIKLDENQKTRLDQLCALRDRSAHSILKKAVVRYIDEETEYEKRKAEDMARWQEFKITGIGIEHDDMMAWLDTLVTTEKSAVCSV